MEPALTDYEYHRHTEPIIGSNLFLQYNNRKSRSCLHDAVRQGSMTKVNQGAQLAGHAVCQCQRIPPQFTAFLLRNPESTIISSLFSKTNHRFWWKW
jgi:hypothetical protein